MQKKVYVYSKHHMDLIWQLGWDRTHWDGDRLLRPYQDLEERQVLSWLRLMDTHDDVTHSVEQTLTLRMVLERNPDLEDVIRQRLHEGRLAVDGGGESIIDMNMVQGESIVRNYLYSIRWLQERFGCRPAVADGTDTFGLSAQMPQILRGLGFDALALHTRVFTAGDLVWQGLDGSRLYIGNLFTEPGHSEVVRKWHAHCNAEPCVCGEEGCDACAGQGKLYNGANRPDPDKLEESFRIVAATGAPRVVLYLASERQVPTDAFPETLGRLAEEYGYDVEYVTLDSLRRLLGGPVYGRFKDGTLRDEDISPKSEGNPVCTGCYLSRIKLKQLNRELENRLYAGEAWAAIAAGFGMRYPRKKLERLWRRMALLQFHDAITSSHTDPCYEDLLALCIEVRGGIGTTADEAVRVLGAQVGSTAPDGWRQTAVFNPLGHAAGDVPFEVWLDWPDGVTDTGVELADTDGNPVCVLACEPRPELGRVRVRFSGTTIPAFGYRTLRWRPANAVPAPDVTEVRDGKPVVLENGRYRIIFDKQGAGAVFDKELNAEVTGTGFGGLMLQEDHGSPWETLNEPLFERHLQPFFGIHAYTLEKGPGFSSVVMNGTCVDGVLARDRGLRHIDWKQTVTLYDGLPGIHIRTEIEWDTDNMRIALRVPLAFRPERDGAYYEIPFGVLERHAYEPVFGHHTKPNGDWPAVNGVTCVNGADGYSVTLCNRGLPCYRVKDGTMLLGLVRSPRIPVYISNFKGAGDPGPHVFETVVYTDRGGVDESRMVQRGLEFNARFLAAPVAGNGTLSAAHSFIPPVAENVALAAVKRAEDNGDLVVRAWECCGKNVAEGIAWPEKTKVRATDLLEQEAGDTDARVFRAFEIKTVRVKE